MRTITNITIIVRVAANSPSFRVNNVAVWEDSVKISIRMLVK